MLHIQKILTISEGKRIYITYSQDICLKHVLNTDSCVLVVGFGNHYAMDIKLF